MQLKIEGRNKLGQLKMVLLHADTITDNEVRNALQMVGFPLSNTQQGYDVLHSTGVKDQVGRYITNDDLQHEREQARAEGRREAESMQAAVPEGFSVISDKELADRINQAYERGKAECKVETPQTFPIPADVWNGKHYGEFVSIPGFAPDSIPGASEHGYEVVRGYLPRVGSVNSNVFDFIPADRITTEQLDSGDYVAVLIVLMR